MKQQYVIACDLGTGGCKSSLYDVDGKCLDDLFYEYSTYYPSDNRHEQMPSEWWSSVKASIKGLLAEKPDEIRSSIAGIGLSGHSLGMVPIDDEGRLLLDSVPIWSDSRPGDEELKPFFSRVPEEEWYMLTGNGFPPALYTVFKILWMKQNQPEVFSRTKKVIGTKDYINLMLSGTVATDFSYASGSGVYDLKEWKYSDRLINAAGLEQTLFPDIFASSDVIGTVLPEIATELGLGKNVKVIAGGVDNSCMALGAKCFSPGRIYNSLGSSSWIAVSSESPLLDIEKRPYVFTHVVPGLFASATAIFSAGSSYKWFTQILSEKDSVPDFKALDQAAGQVPPGSENLLFNPSLAGGSSLDKSPDIRAAFLGLSLLHKRSHMVRSVMEGVGYGLKVALDVLTDLTEVEKEITIVGGGSKSPVWCQILADIFGMKVIKTNIDQQAAALGAAALVLVGCGIWEDYSKIDDLHQVESISQVNSENHKIYKNYLAFFKDASEYLADLGKRMRTK
jgi:xylulokinase